MMARTHLLGSGLLLWVLGLGNIDLLCGLVFSVLPDIDTPRSFAGRLFPFSRQIEEQFGHRTVTHSLLFAGVVALGGGLGPSIGIASHLLLDMLTPNGIQLLWPANVNFVVLGGTIATGGDRERIVFALMLLACLVLSYMHFCKLSHMELLRNLIGGRLVCRAQV